MDITSSLIRDLGSELELRSQGDEGRDAIERFEMGGIDVGRATTPIELARSCHGTDSVEWSRSVVAGLLSLAPDDEMAALSTLVALGPGLAKLANRWVAAGWDWAEAESAVVGSAVEAVIGPPLGGETIGSGRATSASEVVARARRQVRNEDRRRGRRQSRETSLGSGSDAEEADPGERVSIVLSDAVKAGVLSPDQAFVVWASRVDGVAATEIARLLDRSVGSVRQSRRRAEQRLAVLWGDQGMER